MVHEDANISCPHVPSKRVTIGRALPYALTSDLWKDWIVLFYD